MSQNSSETCLNSPDVDQAASTLFSEILERKRDTILETSIFFRLVNMRLLREFVGLCVNSCPELDDTSLIAEIIKLLGTFTQQVDYAYFQLGDENSDPEKILATLISSVRQEN